MGSRSLLAMLKKKEKNRERRTKEKGKPETEKKNSYHCHGLSKLLLLLESIPRNKEEQEASQQKKQKEDVVERGIETKKKKKKKNGHIELHSQAACHHRKHQACGTEMVPNSVHSTVVAHLEKTYLNLQHHQNNTGAFKSRNRDESNPAKLAL
jgi:hypothetical protein